MCDRDIPSVPVTTLAGLTSLSDLLSELPVSDSFFNSTPLHKSLLFHNLVANESNNLLSIRDDNLVRQLVRAIEQTNSDKIELKSQYNIHQHGANISTYPELLQGIYNFRPTVFNTTQYNSNNPQQNCQEKQQIDNCQGNIPVTEENIIALATTTNSHVPTETYPQIVQIANSNHLIEQTPLDSELNHSVNVNVIDSSSVIKSPNKYIDQNNIYNQLTTNQLDDPNPNVVIPTQSQFDTIQLQNQVIQQNPLIQQNSIIQENNLIQENNIIQENSIIQQNNIVQQTEHVEIQNNSSLSQYPVNQQAYVEEISIVPTIHPLNTSILPQEVLLKVSEESEKVLKNDNAVTDNIALTQAENTLSLVTETLVSLEQEQSVVCPNILNQQLQEIQLITEKNAYENFSLFTNADNKELQNQLLENSLDIAEEQQLLSSVLLCNTQADPHIDKNIEQKILESAGNKPQVRVCINRLKEEHARQMQHSIKGFVQKGDIIKKIDTPVTEMESSNITEQNLTDDKLAIMNSSTSSYLADTFTLMKADENRVRKRKPVISLENIPPDQIYSKPKVRKVERIVATILPKFTKEEISKSQTYQQFMRNLEQITEQIDDTETPNFESDDIDDNIECISSKMLNTMSNDVAKLKAKNALDSIPKNKLTLLINFAMRNVYLAKNYSAGPDDEDEIVDDEVMDKILNAIEACLLICNIYSTTKDLKFLQEDNISLIIKFIQFQFRETIFPSYDSVYTVKSMKRSDNRKKSKPHHNHNRALQLLYSKSVELMKVFVTLFDKCIFVDTVVLPLSTLAIEPFFVDNIETLQFVCLELVTTIFRKEQYDKIRSCILGDILASIDRLPSSKRNLRPFKLANNGGNIQMVTSLVLQLIQCATILPDSLCENEPNAGKNVTQDIINIEGEMSAGATKLAKQNEDVIVLKKYDVAISIGGNFLTTFLNKCKTRSNETDFRPLFENFIHDLLATVNKPEWPASELLLSLLGTMLVRYVSDKTIEQSIRLVSLDYLGIVAARLRKDTVESRCKVNIIDSMILSIKAEQEKEGELLIQNSTIVLGIEEERTEFLQRILLDFLAVNAQEENLIWDYARHFYLAQWYRDIICQRRRINEGEKGYASRKKSTSHKKRKKGKRNIDSSDSSSPEISDDSENDTKLTKNTSRNDVIDQELNLEIFKVLEERKRYLLQKIKPYSSNDLSHTSQHIKTYIDYNNAHLIAQYLATKRPFSQSFDGYLKKIILVVNEQSIAVRTRAMKCLANIVEVDPMVLKRKDMQMGVNQKFLDAAISVREAAVDLVGKFVLSNEELIDQYYDMLSTRILDTGVSVRKRVIKILRDICIEYPDFKKIPEICVKMIRRVNDEEGIQKLVTEVFMKMWFTPCGKNDKHGIQRKINQIIDVVNTAHDTGTAWLEGLLNSIFQPKENIKLEGNAQDPIKKNTEPPQEILLACQQLADGLIDRLIELEDTDNTRMLGCITTLHLLAKVRPQLLIQHAITIEPYLNIKCHPATAPKFICAVADILEKVVPLVNNASESFLATLEEHLMLLVVSLNQAVVTSCVSCLGALVNKITKNYKLIRDCFQKFYRIMDHSRNQVEQHNHTIETIYTPMFRRSLFTIGILMRYFDFKSPDVIGDLNGLPSTICNDAFECLMFFVQCSNYEIRKQALIALGSFCVMNEDYLTRPELRRFYCDLLRSDVNEPSIKVICMRNIWIYLTESEMFMHNKEKEWEKEAQNEDLKEMNDVSSGMASRIIQLYLQEILDCFLNSDDTVRLWAVKVVQIVLRQGLVHPVRMVPYLICLSTDSKLESAHRADALLKEIDKTYTGFVNMKVQFGLQLCFKLQEMLQCNSKNENVIRGYIKRESDTVPSALNDFLYTLLRTTKPQRRALVQTVIKQFDDQKTSLRQMLYIADNLAYFPYVVQDEPLYLIHQIDLLISIAGTNLLTTFKECLMPSENANNVLEDDDDEEDPEKLFKRLPENIYEIRKCITSAQACMLLLILKDHLKDMYGLTDGKISRYSPSEQKLYEKAITRKTVADFNPKSIIDVIILQQQIALTNNDETSVQLNDEEKIELVTKYLDFKQLMLKLDPDDVDSDEEARDKSKLNTSQTLHLNSTVQNQLNNSDLSTTNMNNHNINGEITEEMKEVLTIPAIRDNKISLTTKATNITRKQSLRTKKKKRKIITSDDDDDDDYSDEGYV
ncbi:nipped-B protein [Teleopsis dalmanni]|uniref:nipped-B protein n=1 Tax=Teleopsis dalmanni TaxID=139649 RepID=UPI0018CCD5BE|nr:nipped-B protein [Teleopsis dalmanni]XP_037927463.1 nipped-B protein [Teleopsis dalmanni]